MAYTLISILIFIILTSYCLAQHDSHTELRSLQQADGSSEVYGGGYTTNNRGNWLRSLRERRSKKHRSAPTSKWVVSQSKAKHPVVLKAVAPRVAPPKHVVIPEMKVQIPRQSKNYVAPYQAKADIERTPGKAIECYGKHCIRSLRKRRSRKHQSVPKSKYVAIPYSKGRSEFSSKSVPKAKSQAASRPAPRQKYVVTEVKVPEPSSKNYVAVPRTKHTPPSKKNVPARQPPHVKAPSLGKEPAEAITKCYGKHCTRSLRKRESRKHRSAPSSKHAGNHPDVKTFVLSKYAVEPVKKVPKRPQPQKYVVAPKMIAVPRGKAPRSSLKGKYGA